MASIGGKTKVLDCTVCHTSFTGSLYANPATAKCQQCKKTSKKVGTTTPNQVIHTAPVQLPGVSEPKPIKLLLVRNRQEIEGRLVMDTGEVIDRIPTEWETTVNVLDYLSVSKIKAYEQCPAKFYKNYMSGDQGDNGNIFTWFGSILHEVVEFADKAFTSSGITINPLVVFDDAWKKRELTDLSMYKEARELILDYFARHPIGSEPYLPLMVDGKPTVEFEYRGPFGDVPVFGNMFDFIGELNPKTGLIKDYKSNRRPYATADLEDDLQLQVYEIIARKLFPQYETWVTGFELFRFGWQQCPQRTKEDLQAVEQYVNNIWYQIQHDTAWEERLNVYCGYCDGRATCKKYCEYMKDPQRLIDTIITDTTDLASVERSREQFNILEKLLKDRKDEMSNIVKVAVEHAIANGDKLVIDGSELYLQSQSRPFYDYSPVRNMLTVHGKSDVLDRCLTVNKTKLDAAVKKDPQLAMQLKQCLVQSYTAPYIMKRKAK